MAGQPNQPGAHQDRAREAPARTLHEAIRDLTTELSLDVVLQKVADLSRELVGASYSALGIMGEEGNLVQFITSGISRRGRDRIGRPPEGKGVLGTVLREEKPLRLADLSQHPDSVGFPPNHPNMRSFLGVPIVLKGKVLGDIYLANKIGAKEFSEEDEAMVSLFAGQAAVAIENARLFDAESRRSAQLDALNRIGRELTSILNLDELFRRVADLIQESFHFENVQVFWLDRINSDLQLRAVMGQVAGKIPVGAIQPLEQGIVGWVARNRQTVLCSDVTQDSRYFPQAGFDTSSELAVPVIGKDEILAVINVEGMEPYAFDNSDAQTLETLAAQLAVAIENILLYQQQHDQSRRLAVAEERDRIGRDLHDGVIQSIYAAGLTLEDIAHQAEKQPGEAFLRIEGVVGDLNQVIGDIRSYIMDLRPRELQGRGLDEALDSSVSYLQDKTGATVSMAVETDLSSLSELYTVNLWHIFQEAFSNVEKYARATKVSVNMGTQDGTLNLEITDDGVGFDLQKAELGKGYGISNIKDRAERLGGTLVIASSPGHGTRLEIRIPIK